ncbi:MAG TPA: cysteine desulfurase [Nitrospirae bacterium]|nr:cysteine desulfurase [Nitrospirota bacterium]
MECYFDHVATNPLRNEVLMAMMPYLKEEYGNPLSIYPLGVNAREAIEKARAQVAELVNCKPSEIVFTSSGAEANNFALRGIALARQYEGKHLIVTRMEHHSILNPARFLEKLGFTVTYVNPDRYGYIDPDAIKKAITDETILISVIHASPEVGTIEPIREIAEIAKERNITFHSDGVATVGNIPVDVKELGVDLMSMSAHQFYGPKGAGALYIREGQRIIPLIFGGIQEGGRRAGTENVPAIVGMGKAAEITKSELAQKMEHVRRLRDRLVEGVMKIENVHYTGHPDNRLPGHASFCVEFIEGEGMLLMLAAKGIYVASGSACTSKALKASPVLLSMGIPSHVAHGSIVFSFGVENTIEQVEYTLEEFPQIIKRLRELSPYAKGWEGLEEGGTCIPKK